jgi:hypothetical protein
LLTGQIGAAIAGPFDEPIWTVVVALRATGEVPVDWAELLEAAAVLDVSDIHFAWRRRVLDGAESRQLMARMQIRHGPGIDRWTGDATGSVKISFKRYRSPIMLSGVEALVFRHTTTPLTRPELAQALSDADERDLDRAGAALLRERVLQWQLPDSAVLPPPADG